MKFPKIALGLASLLLATTTLLGGCMVFPDFLSEESSPSPEESPSTEESPRGSDDSPSPRASDEDSPSPRVSDDTSAPQTRDGKVSFILINETNRPMERFFASPSNTKSWEEDIFDGTVLPPNKRVRITIADGRKDCIYDFMATLGPTPDGSVGKGDMVQTKINICNLPEWGFRENPN
jgi:hypothetical protein